MLVIYTNPYRNATKRKISLSSKKAQKKTGFLVCLYLKHKPASFSFFMLIGLFLTKLSVLHKLEL
jgi:hypothetical protein